MWIVRLALRRPYTIAVLCALIAIFGVLSVSRMKTDILPAIDIPVVIVVWNCPGLSTEDMERRVVFISERAMSTTVSGITRIDSQSMNSLGILKVYFEPGSDIGGAIAQIVSVSLTASRIMPPGITPPSIIRYNASNVPVAQMTIGSKTLSEQGGQLLVALVEDGKVHFQRVKLGVDDGAKVEVLDGLRGGETVALNLGPEVLDGSPVRVQQEVRREGR